MRQPIDIPFSGKCDAAGNGTIPINAPVEYWCALYLALEVLGSPVWTIRESGVGGLPYTFGAGTPVVLGPIVIPPRKILSLSVTGANANATIVGKLLGWSAPTFTELPPALPTASSVNISGGVVNATITAGTINVQNVPGGLLAINLPPTSLGSWSVTGVKGTVVSQTVTVPAATHSIQVACTVDCAIAIRGTTTGCYYSKNRFATVSTLVGIQGPVATFEIPINTGIETGYEIRITKNDGSAGTAYGAAILSSECITAKTDVGDPLRVASRIDHTQGIEATPTAVALTAGAWTQLLATGNLDASRQIQHIDFSAVNGTGVTQTFHWRIRGSVSGAVTTIHQAVFNSVEYSKAINYDPHLYWTRLNGQAWVAGDVAIFDCFVNGANCVATINVVYLLD